MSNWQHQIVMFQKPIKGKVERASSPNQLRVHSMGTYWPAELQHSERLTDIQADMPVIVHGRRGITLLVSIA